MTDTQFELASGRKIGVSGYGDPTSNRIVLFCNPTAAAGAYNPDPVVTTRHNVHVIVIDRPGYGGSDPWDDASHPTVQASADDMTEYVTMCGIAERASNGELTVGAVGWGWGGATAISFAAAHPTFISRVAVVGLVRPARARRGEKSASAAELLRLRFISSVAGAARSVDDQLGSGLAALGVDRDDPDLAQLGSVGQTERLVAAAADDRCGIAFDRLAARDTTWADRSKELQAKCFFVYGDKDCVATTADANWYERQIPHSTVVHVVESGRLVIIPTWDAILHHVAG
ncbi:MAG TPA: alpha/beta hydrolase [Galbitalea sp.]|jgi:pimeloyl-ACP methyl ester carboxylesterase